MEVARAGQAFLVDGTPGVGAAWRTIQALLGQIGEIILDPAVRDDVVVEA
jgi:hypothetical protein